jgi:hypothetical protein
MHASPELITSGVFDPQPVNTAVVDGNDVIDALSEPFTNVIIKRTGQTPS